MIESEGKTDFPPGEDRDVRGIVSGDGRAPGPGDENRGDGVLPGIPARVGIGVELARPAGL